jgi:ankyrin repeat protein
MLNMVQDASGWTPLMIAASLPEGDDLVTLLLAKEADVNMKSMLSLEDCSLNVIAWSVRYLTNRRLQWPDSTPFLHFQE